MTRLLSVLVVAALAACSPPPKPPEKKAQPAQSLARPAESRRSAPPPPPPQPPAHPPLAAPMLLSTFDCSGPAGQQGIATIRTFIKFYPDGSFVQLLETFDRQGAAAPSSSVARVGRYELAGERLTFYQTGQLEDLGVLSAARHADVYTDSVIENWTWSRFTLRILKRTALGAEIPVPVPFAVCERNEHFGVKLDAFKRDLPPSLFSPNQAAAAAGREKDRVFDARRQLVAAVNYVGQGGAIVKPSTQVNQCQAWHAQSTQALSLTDTAVSQLIKQERGGVQAPAFTWSAHRAAFENRTRLALELGCVPAGLSAR